MFANREDNQEEKHAKATAQPFAFTMAGDRKTRAPSRVQMTKASFICWLFVIALVVVA